MHCWTRIKITLKQRQFQQKKHLDILSLAVRGKNMFSALWRPAWVLTPMCTLQGGEEKAKPRQGNRAGSVLRRSSNGSNQYLYCLSAKGVQVSTLGFLYTHWHGHGSYHSLCLLKQTQFPNSSKSGTTLSRSWKHRPLNLPLALLTFPNSATFNLNYNGTKSLLSTILSVDDINSKENINWSP